MKPVVIRGDARHLPLPDESVDLICTSPPYWSLRDYRDGGNSLNAQMGSEATPMEYLENLWACTREWLRVLKPSGSIFVNLGDKYVSDNRGSGSDVKRGEAKFAPAGPRGYAGEGLLPRKSLMLLPEAYRLGCNGMLAALGGPDPMGGVPVIVRSVTIWSKPNGL